MSRIGYSIRRCRSPPSTTSNSSPIACCAALREAITSGRLPPDARIKQEQIAAELGVSRTPVREALHLLEREGLVRLVPRRGAIVQGFTAADVRELYELRELLEPAAAALATARADDGRARARCSASRA